MSTRLAPETPDAMFARALTAIENGASPEIVLDIAVNQVAKWGGLVERQDAGELLDGRASIYTGETYAEARDRWDAYRGLLVEHLRGPDGGGA